MSVTAAKGFVANGIAAGIKPSGNRDLSLVVTANGKPVAAAGVFTQNKLKAAPVQLCQSHLLTTGGYCVGVVLNSGNANAATGAQGMQDALAMAQGVAKQLNVETESILVCSTGLIGIPMPIDVITTAIPELVAGRSTDGGVAAATAIMTTDTVSKEVIVEKSGFTVGGMAKGAAMLSPNMATMLAVLTTDAAATPAQLKEALLYGVKNSFNALDVDGCTSTNDTVLLFASGEAGEVSQDELNDAVAMACASLAKQMCSDAEGATKVVTMIVKGAANDEQALKGARYVSRSNLVKCSWYGCDPYWGRIASDLGSCGIEFDPDKFSLAYGGVTVCQASETISHDEQKVADHMAQRELLIEADLGLGNGTATILTNDLTHAYIDENMGTS
ncbi:MAG: bifunctional glutamate N-acetyltransferase/amino-acid acetyltransferase ArgJ [Actinomycetota bacterium]